MRSTILTVFLLFVLLPIATAADLAETEIRAAMAERLDASVKGDSSRVASLMADEYIQTDIFGYVQDKGTWLKEYFDPVATLIKAGKFHWEEYDQGNLQFRVFGDVAVVMGTLELKGSGARWVAKTHTWAEGRNVSFSGTMSFTHVYVKRNGRWLLVALHNAIPFKPPLQ